MLISIFALAITFILMISVLVFPVVFLLNLDPVVQQVIASVNFAFAGYGTIIILFGPKIFALVFSKSDEDASKPEVKQQKSKISPEVDATKATATCPLTKAAANLDKVVNPLERVAYIKKQMEEWGVLLMKEIDNAQRDIGSGVSAHPEYEVK
jgi:hypothetical protein